jgi:glycosyltransferase involved in cell wall biosynthesis
VSRPDVSTEGDARPFVSIVVPTWNRAALLPACLDSLVEQDYPADRYEVVVVDDGSTDETPSVVRRYAERTDGPAVRLVQQANGGVNRARNAGVAAAAGDLVALVDDDEAAPPAHLSRAVELLAAHPGVDGVGGPAIDDGRGGVRTCEECNLATVVLRGDRAGESDRLLGGNMIVRRAAFDAVGPFEPTLSGRGDETEWFHRAGMTFFYEPSLLVWHSRAHLSLWQLGRTQFRQGRALPRGAALRGERYRPDPTKLARLLAHAARRRCGGGLARAARELGAMREWSMGRTARRPPP